MGIFDGSAGFQYRFAYLSAMEVLAKSIEIRTAGQRAAHRYDWMHADGELWRLLDLFVENFQPVADPIRKVRFPRGVVLCGFHADSAHDAVEKLARATHGATGLLAKASNAKTRTYPLKELCERPGGLSLLSSDEIAELKADLREEAEQAFCNATGSVVATGSLAIDTPVGFLGGEALADALDIHATRRKAFFRQLERARNDLGDDCWHEVHEPRPNNPRFLYRADSPRLRQLAAAYKTPKLA